MLCRRQSAPAIVKLSGQMAATHKMKSNSTTTIDPYYKFRVRPAPTIELTKRVEDFLRLSPPARLADRKIAIRATTSASAIADDTLNISLAQGSLRDRGLGASLYGPEARISR